MSLNFFEEYCLKCNSKCCKNWTVFVTIKDLQHIKKFAKLEYLEFSNFSIVQEDELLLYSKKQNNYFYDYIVNGKVLQIKKQNGLCIFLNNNRCSIYKCRPLICKLYPFWFFEKGKKIEVKLSIDYYNVCIIPASYLEVYIKKNYNDLIKLYKLYIKEIDHYKRNLKFFIRRYYDRKFI